MHTHSAINDTAFDVIAQSRSLVESNQRLLSATRYRVAASRRRLNPAFALVGASDEDYHSLLTSIRARLASGALFRVGSKAFAGYGTENPCVVCRASIGRREVEYEIPLGEGIAVVSHLPCYFLWRTESTRHTVEGQLGRQ